MFKNFFKNYIYPISIISGSIIGVGFLSLPYIASITNIWLMVFYMVVLTALVATIHSIMGKIALKTPDFKRWPGFIGFYFGDRVKKIFLLPMILGSFGVLLAYLIVGSQFLQAILSPLFGGEFIVYVLGYFIVLGIAVYFGPKLVSRLEFGAIVFL